MQTAEDILNGPGYFYCERFRARMSKQSCVGRQNKKYNPNTGESIPLECERCEQGAAIKAEVEGERLKVKGAESGRLQPKSLTDLKKEIRIMDASTSTDKVFLCKECKERPAIMNSKTKRPLNGRCSVCHGKAIRKAFKEKGYNRKKKGTIKDDNSIIVTLDFRGHDDIYNEIEAEAREELRTVENQIIYRLREAVSNALDMEE